LKIVEIGKTNYMQKVGGGQHTHRAQSTRIVDSAVYDSLSERSSVRHDRRALLFPNHH